MEAASAAAAARRRPYRVVVGGDWPVTVAVPPTFEIQTDFSNYFQICIAT
jgi:hypothetical protein